MSKKLTIPPIKPNPRRGNETATDASVVWSGAQLSKQSPVPTAKKKPPSARVKQPGQPGRRRRQQNFGIAYPDQLIRLAKKLGISQTAVVNLALSQLAEKGL